MWLQSPTLPVCTVADGIGDIQEASLLGWASIGMCSSALPMV